MIYITLITIFILVGFLVVQRFIIHKYKELNFFEKSLVASLTHDLKSPASAQINMLNLLLKGNFGKLNPKQYEMIKLTCSSSKYMSNLVGTILTNYQCETNSILLNKKYFDIVRLVNELLLQNQFLITDKNLRIIFTPFAPNCIVYADELQIERVINNLLTNAITYSLKDTEIIIKINHDTKFIEFSISNKSNPITEKELKNIFQRFSRTNNSRLNKYSTGLGLYSSKRIIDLHQGTIYAKSSPDGTCTFGFKLKTVPEPAKI